MDTLILIAALAGIAVLLRRQIRSRRIDWRSLAGFVCGAVLGMVWSGMIAPAASAIVLLSGIPWFAFRLFFAIVGGLMGAAAGREIIDRAFPRNPEERKSDNDGRRR